MKKDKRISKATLDVFIILAVNVTLATLAEKLLHWDYFETSVILLLMSILGRVYVIRDK